MLNETDSYLLSWTICTAEQVLLGSQNIQKSDWHKSVPEYKATPPNEKKFTAVHLTAQGQGHMWPDESPDHLLQQQTAQKTPSTLHNR